VSDEVVILSVGDRVKFAEEKQRYTVRAVTRGGRFAILRIDGVTL
jgi:predicted 2-oxoglutarate/Fe(II)-dependent dioxygenase YbiX